MDNKKQYIIGTLIVISSIVVSLFALIPINKKESNTPCVWMKDVNDSKIINEMSIPGTHDSGALHSIFDVAGKCQDIDINTQLNIGVRFFDLRLQLVENDFKIVHSFVNQNLSFSSVMDDISSFIRKYDSEFILISLKKEASDINSSKEFKDALLEKLKNYEDVLSYDKVLPNTIKEARGKIYIIDRYDLSVGINAYSGWLDSETFTINNLYVQDNYCINDINVKKEDILSTIKYSNENNDKLVLNFTSCYLDYGFPPTYAGTSALIINPWLKTQIQNKNDRLGIIVADFIDKELAESIYMRNM
ncbi:MAG: phosphatidylinositol-specific phospholipase C [Bacilli bacterium]|nr:phosphatidylinositol-specific phospholipase C [Bacilli bacterium]